MIAKQTTQRLAFIKYIYKLGVDQSLKPEPLNAVSVLTFHDSVELFLQLASEFLDVGKTGIGFLEYWDIFNRKLTNAGLTQKETMRRLNSSRVSFKHHGTLPSKLDIESFRVNTANFFRENTKIIFKLVFDEISLIDLITYESTNRSLNEAQQQIINDNPREAAYHIAIAYKELIAEYEDRKRSRFGNSPFVFGEDFSYGTFELMDSTDDEKLRDFLEKLMKSIESIQSTMKVVALGLEYRQYSKFLTHVPNVTKFGDGRYQGTWISEYKMPSIDDCKFCIDFIIESALHLQGFDYETPTFDYKKGGWVNGES